MATYNEQERQICFFYCRFLDRKMEASAALSLQSCSWIGSEKVGRKTSGFARLSNRCLEERKVAMVRFGDPRRSGASIRTGHAERKIFCCHKKPSGEILPSFFILVSRIYYSVQFLVSCRVSNIYLRIFTILLVSSI